MTMNEFFMQYAQKWTDAIMNGDARFSTFRIECELCPLRTACQKDSENGGEMNCDEFIKSQLTNR